MTPAERALLLEMAARMTQAEKMNDERYWSLQHLIAAVEAEAVPEAPAEDRSCETCRFSEGEDCTAGPGFCLPPSMKMWQPKPDNIVPCHHCVKE